MHNSASGQCLCGEVRFEVAGAFENFFLCHCSRCRKDSGSAHSANLFSSTAQLIWLSREDAITTLQLPDTDHVKNFCARCGSAVLYVLTKHGVLVVPAGALDSSITNKPNGHICCASRAEWDTDLESLVRINGLPG